MRSIRFPSPIPAAPFTALILALAACDVHAGPPPLVPSTADEDPAIPSISITVAGRTRHIRLRAYGPEAAPVLLVMPGSLSDIDCYAPFAEFGDSYRVIMWDQRGQGLSERVDRAELSFDTMLEEIAAVKAHFSPDRPVALLGHSWSAIFAGMFAGLHPAEVDRLILMEPFGFKVESMRAEPASLNLFTRGYLDMAWFSDMAPSGSHEELDFRMRGMLGAGVRNFFKDPDHPPPWPVRRVGGLALLVWEAALYEGSSWDFDLSGGLAEYPGRVLLVGSRYSPIGAEFQTKWNAPLFSGASEVAILSIEDSGHRMVTENWQALSAGIRAFMETDR